MSNQEHLLLIKYHDKVEFKAIFKDQGHYRVQIDLAGYTEALEQLLSNGYRELKQIGTQSTLDGHEYPKIEYGHKRQYKDISEVVDFFKQIGCNCIVEPLDQSHESFSVIGEGKELYPGNCP